MVSIGLHSAWSDADTIQSALTVTYVVLGISAVFYGTVNDIEQPRIPVACLLNIKTDCVLVFSF
jgi:hypothetical protein